MADTTLLIMAAGMGSRFGGLKQLAPLGPHGELLLDYSVYDAAEAGFQKFVFIIKKELEHDFRTLLGKRLEARYDVSYVFQDAELPEGRVKPWGTGHAVLCAKGTVHTPFAVINADDYYGRSSYRLLQQHLTNDSAMCMVGFALGNTLTENGTVSRGVCRVENGYLKQITEHTALDKSSGIPLDTTVSMNMWGLQPAVFDVLEQEFQAFLSALSNPQKDEFFLPAAIDRMIQTGQAQVKVLKTDEKWYGVTYPDDAAAVRAALAALTKKGLYQNV